MARRTAPPAPVAEPLFEAPAREPNILSEIPLGKIAEHYGRTPEEQLYAILGTRWASIEAEGQKGEVG